MKERVNWIDCAKAVAMIAVVVDHCGDFIYDNFWIGWATIYAVSLFVMLSGVSMGLAAQNGKRITLASQARKAAILFAQYALATLITVICYNRFLDLRTYVSCLLSFSAQFVYYYILFYLQILLISPFLIKWCQICNARKGAIVWHLVTLLGLGVLGAFSVNFTYILPVAAGGQYLFGGTYILVFYIGVLLANWRCFDVNKKNLIYIAVISMILWIVWYYLYGSGEISALRSLDDFWGVGVNPPGVQMIIYTLITLFLCYSVFSLLDMSKSRIICRGKRLLVFIGKNTINIYLYHILVEALMLRIFPNVTNPAVMWIVDFIPMVIVPAIATKTIVNAFNKMMGDCIR